ncbi:hypothetical protein [Vibrio anguillarum]|uniref:Uncharacterized protein n=1 Tax=Vibrio anguillarum TaxID=55601 RepID=A0ABR9Z8T5_VIBAN|nr:hypothetical protein [Vibrio anguillarum]MBF4374514.1 hypothetical protein [Vibrio anguillarum]
MGRKLERLKVVLWRYVHCPFGKHIDPVGKANFCGACGQQLNPDAYSQYKVALKDGSEILVMAVNENHAASLVIYGEQQKYDTFSVQNGTLDRVAKVHSDNILSVIKI